MSFKEKFYARVHGPNHHWYVISVTALGTFMTTYDMGAVNISLPRIMASFHTSLTATSWVLLSFLLTTTIFLLPAGKLGDLIGRKKVYNIGFLIFITGSMLAGLSQGPTQLIIFRVIQGIGASMLQTNSFAIITAVFPDKERGKGLGIGSTMAAIGTTAGPAIGGLLVNALGWRGIFFLNVPVGLVGTVLAYLILQEKLVSTSPDKVGRNFDFPGAALAAVTMSSLLIGLSLGQQGNWSGWDTRLFLVIAAAGMIVFPIFESRRTNPLVDVRLFNNRTFGLNNAARLICFLSISSNILLMPFYLQIVLGFSPAKAGLMLVPMNVALALISPVAGWMANFISTRVLASSGMFLIGIAAFFLSWLSPTSGFAAILIPLIILGLGHGIFQTPNNTSVMDSVTRDKFGMASGILSLVRQTGQSLGIAIASTIVVASIYSTVGQVSLYSLKRSPELLQQGGALMAFSNGISHAYLFAAIVSGIGILCTLSRGKTERDKGIHAR
ncbi:MAG: MFS transporter [Dehalococcoidia bacterium]|nr:MFS transporter [Dehalococcoidia bacterium]